MKYDADKIRNLNSLSDWLERYGVIVNAKGFAKCPFHDEKDASFKVYPEGKYHCFGCGAHGDVITLVMQMQHITFPEACALLDGDISYSQQRRIDRAKRQRQKQTGARKKAISDYWSAFDEWKENEDLIELFKPSSPEITPNSLFFIFLNKRNQLQHKLNLAETVYIKRGELSG